MPPTGLEQRPAAPATDIATLGTATLTEAGGGLAGGERTGGDAAAAAPWLWIAALLAVLCALVGLLILRARRRGAPEPDTRGETAAGEGRVSVGTAQYIGDREDQQDALCCSEFRDDRLVDSHGMVAAIADGVGGMSDGRLASTTAVKGLLSRFAKQSPSQGAPARLLQLVADAHADVLALNRGRSARCGSTLVAALVVGRELSIASIGDSRAYLYRGGGLIQLNREHVLGSQYDEQLAIGSRPSEDMPERRRAAITAYLGKEDLRLIDRTTHPIRLYGGDKLALMSDGVFGTLGEDELASALALEPKAAAQAAIDAVRGKQRPHQDNASIIVIGF